MRVILVDGGRVAWPVLDNGVGDFFIYCDEVFDRSPDMLVVLWLASFAVGFFL